MKYIVNFTAEKEGMLLTKCCQTNDESQAVSIFLQWERSKAPVKIVVLKQWNGKVYRQIKMAT